jgi:negative regulator of flagellin synthesis FlgM
VQDRLEFSSAARNFEELVEKAVSAPEVRAERVAEIKEALESGNYSVKADQVADAIIKGSLIDIEI